MFMCRSKDTQKCVFTLICLSLYTINVISAQMCRDSYTPITCRKPLSGNTVSCKQCDKESNDFHHVIDCVNRYLKEIPECNEHNVECLNLRKNNITTLTSFGNYNQLKTLGLEDNNLTEIGAAAFNRLLMLEELLLHSNRIHTLHEDAFEGLHAIETINLASNKLLLFPVSTFQNLNSLKNLYIGQNMLSTLPNEAFIGTSITHLDLSNNLLTRVQEELFENLQNLETLKLKNNSLRTFPVRLLQLMSLKNFDLSENEFNCNCQSDVIDLSKIFSNMPLWKPPTCLNGRNFAALERVCEEKTNPSSSSSRPATGSISSTTSTSSSTIISFTGNQGEHQHWYGSYIIGLICLVCLIIMFCLGNAIYFIFRRRKIKKPPERFDMDPHTVERGVSSISSTLSSTGFQKEYRLPFDSNQNTIIFNVHPVTVQRDNELSLSNKRTTTPCQNQNETNNSVKTYV